MSLVCQLSGQVCQEPTVSPSGGVYERRIIAKYVQENGKDPISNEQLTVDDLIVLKQENVPIAPRPPSATSIPSLLALFQNEWDAIMLETFNLKQTLDQTQKELVTALYEKDAALRVIARLSRERDEARHALAAVKGGVTHHVQESQAEPMETDQVSKELTEFRSKIESTAQDLVKERKKRKGTVTAPSKDQLAEYSEKHKIAHVHGKASGIVHMVVGHEIASSAKDGSLAISNLKSSLHHVDKAHGGKKIGALAWHGHHLISGGADKQVRLWDVQKGLVAKWAIKNFDSEIVGVASHPCSDYIVAADKSKLCVANVQGQTIDTFPTDTLYSLGLHPDGMLLAAGSDAGIKVWDLKGYTVVATLETSPAQSLAFAENGYSLASSSGDNVVQIWDLRKLGQAATEIDVGSKVHGISWDTSASYLGVASGHELSVYANKSWDEVWRQKGVHGNHDVTQVGFASQGELISSGNDGSIHVFG